MDFNPDLSDNIEEKEDKKKEVFIPAEISTPNGTIITSVADNSSEAISIKNLVSMTVTHMEDDVKCRDTVEEINKTLDGLTDIMSAKELTEYLKVKLNERRFHVECIFKAFEFIQKTEIAKEMLLGAERKERIIKAANSNTYNKLMGMLNMHSNDDTGNM